GLAHRLADRRQLDVHDVGELLLRPVGDAHGDHVTVDLRPLVLLGVTEPRRNLRHVVLPWNRESISRWAAPSWAWSDTHPRRTDARSPWPRCRPSRHAP